MFCSNCGAQNPDTARFCEKCGTAVVASPSPAAAAVDTRVRGVEAAPTRTGQVVSGKNPWVALVLSLIIVGVGQFYNGDVKKGAVMLVGGILGFVISAGIIWLAIWIWSMIDAYLVASGKGKTW